MKLRLIFVFGLLITSCKREGLVQYEYFENGNIKFESGIVNGILNGPFTEYYITGEKEAVGNFVNGKYEGTLEHFFVSGKLKSRAMWRNGKQHGLANVFFESGIKQFEANYKEGVIGGVSKVYFENGNLRERKKYDSQGNIVHITTFQPDGPLERSFLVPYAIVLKDTVSLDEEVIVSLSFPEKEMDGEIFIKSYEKDINGHVEPLDEVFKCTSRDSILFKHKFLDVGSYKLLFEFDHVGFKIGDTLNVKDVGKECTIVVLAPRSSSS